jgi:hypothetical protein
MATPRADALQRPLIGEASLLKTANVTIGKEG